DGVHELGGVARQQKSIAGELLRRIAVVAGRVELSLPHAGLQAGGDIRGAPDRLLEVLLRRQSRRLPARAVRHAADAQDVVAPRTFVSSRTSAPCFEAF